MRESGTIDASFFALACIAAIALMVFGGGALILWLIGHLHLS